MFEIARLYARELMLRRFAPNRLATDARREAWQLAGIVREMPYQVHDLLEELRDGQMEVGFKHKGLGDLLGKLDILINRLVPPIVVMGGLLGSSILVAFAKAGPEFLGVNIPASLASPERRRSGSGCSSGSCARGGSSARATVGSRGIGSWSAPYDEHVEFYLDFVERGLTTYLPAELAAIDEPAWRTRSRRVRLRSWLWRGYLGRHLVAQGASRVVGVDLPSGLIDAARRRATLERLDYLVDDARELGSPREWIVRCRRLAVSADGHGRPRPGLRRGSARAEARRCVPVLRPPPVLRGHAVSRRARAEVRRRRRRDANSVRGLSLRDRGVLEVGWRRRTGWAPATACPSYVNAPRRGRVRDRAFREPIVEGRGLFAEVPTVLLVLALAA